MANKGKISVDSEDEIREIEKELEEELRYAVASSKGIVPADAVIKLERKMGRPTGGLSAESKKAGGKKSRIKRGQTYKPTDDDYSKVEEMVTIGLDQHTISKVMGISNATLTKYFSHNLLVGREKRTARVAGVAYEMAVSGESPSMTTFWLKTQAGWSPKHTVVVEDRQFDIQWAKDEADIADANQMLKDTNSKVH
jgi:hypothetical protein|tara:strand:- start:869 stop:1456 length:588 start_codon:yes stop_codon:yes gene_type:complete